MRLFVALGIVLVIFLVLAAKIARHHRRTARAPVTEDLEVDARTPAVPVDRRPSLRSGRAWSGPTLRELLDKAEGPAEIRGHARGPAGAAIAVRAAPTGKRERGRRIPVADDGSFEIHGLLFGRSYDLTFDGPNLRQTTLRSVTAPASDVEATLERAPMLRGAIGFPAGGACSYDRVELRTEAAEDDQSGTIVGMDDNCRFELQVPDGPSRMVLLAIGDGPHLEMPISIPPVGDPDPVCLNPPCLADPPKETARLRIAFQGEDHSDVSATVVFAEGDHSTSYNCFTSGEACELEALPTSPLYKLSADSSDCATATRTMTLQAGDNDVTFPCEPKTSATAGDDEPAGVVDLGSEGGDVGSEDEHVVIRDEVVVY
jgi:hypothetical protein